MSAREMRNPIDEGEKLKRSELRWRVEHSQSYDELFEIIKRMVEDEIGKHRAGLALVLADMPNVLGAYHPLGSNVIVLNRALVKAMDQVVKNKSEINSFIFMVLMHEYLHSLGFLDEIRVRKTCAAICSSALGQDHLTVRMATGNWLEMYPQLQSAMTGFSKDYERVDKFDSSSMSYIG
jgi:hypothetical protein